VENRGAGTELCVGGNDALLKWGKEQSVPNQRGGVGARHRGEHGGLCRRPGRVKAGRDIVSSNVVMAIWGVQYGGEGGGVWAGPGMKEKWARPNINSAFFDLNNKYFFLLELFKIQDRI
jgi:hypothetical protein